MSLYDDDHYDPYNPLYSDQIDNMYYSGSVGFQQKTSGKSKNNNTYGTNIFKLIGILIIMFFIFYSMTK